MDVRFGEVEMRARVKNFGGVKIFWESGMVKKVVCKPQRKMWDKTVFL